MNQPDNKQSYLNIAASITARIKCCISNNENHISNVSDNKFNSVEVNPPETEKIPKSISSEDLIVETEELPRIESHVDQNTVKIEEIK